MIKWYPTVVIEALESMANFSPEHPNMTHDGKNAHREELHGRRFLLLCLTALGVVYGDLGTSPIYAPRECFYGSHPFPPTSENVLGVLSLVFWVLLIVVSCKYVLFVMRADNQGEGGILALLALLVPKDDPAWKTGRISLWFGLFGAALLFGDGMITPAISVLSAVEGINVATPAFERFVVPLTVLILFLLFLFQKRGTARVGMLFGPIMAAWFAAIAVLGMAGIARAPGVLAAVNPAHALAFFRHHGWSGFLVLGGISLAVTGAEALYADMGHFGRRPIKTSWLWFVFPALLLNYFGQGALLLKNPEGIKHPFYQLAPDWALYPLVFLATLATVIASQAVISGVFSLTRQAMQLVVCPRMLVVQTSSEEIGQVYVPAANWILMIATILLVLGFRSSSNLAAAFGLAVTGTMLATTLLAFLVSRERWGWNSFTAGVVALVFLSVDLSLTGANLLKLAHGAWFPLVVGVVIFTLMTTWRTGRELLAEKLQRITEPLDEFLGRIADHPPVRVPGTAVFVTGRLNSTPPVLVHHLEHSRVLHEKVVLLTVVTENVPRIPAAERLEISELGQGFFRVLVRYGFMQSPKVPVVLRECEQQGLEVDPDTATFYLERETLIPTEKRRGMSLWREKVFSFMVRNALHPTLFYGIPPERVVEVGIQVEI